MFYNFLRRVEEVFGILDKDKYFFKSWLDIFE